MIVWSGRGFLSILVLLVTLFLSILVLPNEISNISFVISGFTAGIFSWYFGTKWNSEGERIVMDEKTGERLIIKNDHTLFWIPMQYWGIIFSILAVVILYQNSILFGAITSIILIIAISYTLITKQKKEEIKNENILQVKKDIKIKTEVEKMKEFESSNHNNYMPK